MQTDLTNWGYEEQAHLKQLLWDPKDSDRALQKALPVASASTVSSITSWAPNSPPWEWAGFYVFLTQRTQNEVLCRTIVLHLVHNCSLVQN